jgi:hypothetical protein
MKSKWCRKNGLQNMFSIRPNNNKNPTQNFNFLLRSAGYSFM